MHHEIKCPKETMLFGNGFVMPAWAISNEPNSRKYPLGNLKKIFVLVLSNHGLSRDAWPDVSRFGNSIMSIKSSAMYIKLCTRNDG